MRRLLYLLTVVSVVVAGGVPVADAAKKEKKAKYVFFFIGDGMGINQVNGTEMYMAAKNGRIGIEPLNFTTFPVRNFVTTYSEFNAITCSAAAGTALATGQKTRNGTIAMDKERKSPLYSIAAKAKELGMKVGIASDNSIDHATPACFYAHQPNRGMSYEIATDLPKAGFDFYAGAGFLKPVKKDSTDIYTLFDEAGYTLARGNDEFLKKWETAEKIIFMQKEDADMECLPYVLDRKEGDLTLEEITQGAISFLSKDNKDGFFVMIECGLIDWACHVNDAASMFNEVIDFQKSIQRAIDFYRSHPDETLIIVTADHETGGFALGSGSYELNLGVLQYQSLSKSELTGMISALRTSGQHEVEWEDVKELLGGRLGFWSQVTINESEERELKRRYEKAFGNAGKQEMVKSLYAEDEPLAGTAVDILNRKALLHWGCGGHTAGYVPLFVMGVGAEIFNGKIDNTDIPKRIEQLIGY